MTRLMNAAPRRRSRISASDYLRLTVEDRANIAKVRIIPPALGRHDFGGFEVTYKRPVFIVHGCPTQQ